MPVRRPLRALTAGLGAVVVALLVGVPALSAGASLGSVPVVVSDYVASGQLQARLEQVYGPGAKAGSGVDFDATTKPGPISRVYEWTADRYAHADSDHPIQLTNYWTVPITIAEKPVGVAAVWINPRSDQPELAEFTASVPLATALAAVPADAALVHDGATAAWYGVAKGTATPLVSGRSGVTKPTPVADLALSRAPATPQPSDGSTGVGFAIGVLVLLVIVIAGTVLLPRLLRPAKPAPAAKSIPETPADDAAGAADEPASPSVSAVAQEPMPASGPPAPEPAVAPVAPKPRAPATPRTPAKPRVAGTASGTTGRTSTARPRTPVTQKPAASKPTGTKPATAKPAASKPAASKPPRSRPSTPASPPSTPPAAEPPTPRARPKKPPTDEAPET